MSRGRSCRIDRDVLLVKVKQTVILHASIDQGTAICDTFPALSPDPSGQHHQSILDYFTSALI